MESEAKLADGDRDPLARLTPEHAYEVWRLVERCAAEEPASGKVMPLGAERAASQVSRSQRLRRKIA
jgi:hypothetical protein